MQVHLFVNLQVKLLTKLRQGRMGEVVKIMSMFFIQTVFMNPPSGIELVGEESSCIAEDFDIPSPLVKSSMNSANVA